MASHDFRVAWQAGAQAGDVSARLYHAAAGPPAWLILAPGAGAGHDHDFMVTFARALASRGLNVVTFNFPYIERGRRVPDPNATLEACWQAVLADVREKAGTGTRIFAGGKSMGGRIASQVAAHDPQSWSFAPHLGAPSQSLAPHPGAPSQSPAPHPGAPSQSPAPHHGAPSQSPAPHLGAPSQSPAPHPGTPSQSPAPPVVAGLVFLGYPLHPPGRPDQRRTAHWPRVRVPALFIQGSRDPFGSPEELREELPHFGGETRLLIVDEGDHSFKVRRQAGRAQAAVYAQVQDWIVEWISATCKVC